MKNNQRRSQSGTVSFPVVFVCSSFQIQNVQENTYFSESQNVVIYDILILSLYLLDVPES